MAASKIYRPLDKDRREIRILHIQGSHDQEAPVQCELETVSLLADPKPRYEAISYCWGDKKDRERMILNDVKFEAPASAAIVIRKFRPISGYRALWIDALCINQDDLQERGHQVKLMGQVYGSTLQTLIWLGDHSTTIERAIETIKTISSDFFDDVFDSRGHFKTFQLIHDDRWSEVLGQGSINAIFQLLEIPWFSRVWVVQEAALASRSLCYCGPFEITWREICRAIMFIVNQFPDPYFAPSNQSRSGVEMCILGYMHFGLPMDSYANTSDREEPYVMRLPSLLSMARNLNATDARDKFYGLLGLTQWAHDDQEFPGYVTVDYSKAVFAVFRDATRAAILEYGLLDVLQAVDENPFEARSLEQLCLPSWVPRWDLWEAKDMPWTFRTPDACAGKHRYPFRKDLLLDNDTNSGILSLEGFEADRVSCVLQINQMLDQRREEYRAMSPSSKQLPSSFVRDVILALSSLMEIGILIPMIITLTAGHLFEVMDDTERQNFIDRLTDFLSHASPGSGLDLVRSEHFCELFSKFWREVDKRCENRRVFRTVQGRIGLGPISLQQGDRVVVLLGGHYPFVLRSDLSPQPERLRCRLVGHCFVCGIMKGQAVRLFEDAGMAPTIFDIW